MYCEHANPLDAASTDGKSRVNSLTSQLTSLLRLVPLIFLVHACDPAPSANISSAESQQINLEVQLFMDSIPEGLADDGPMAWLRFFEDTPQFLMASDGQIAFANRESAVTFLDGFSPTVSTMSLTWKDMRVELLSSSTATVASAYHESITSTDSTTVSFGGFVTGVVRKGDDGWKVQHLHWSSPAASDDN